MRALALDCEGYLWLGTNVGLTRFDGQVFQEYPRAAAARSLEPIGALVSDGGDGLWTVSPRLGPGRVECGGRVAMPLGPVPADFRFIDVAPAGADTAWIATGEGVRLATRGSQQALRELPDGIVGEGVTLMAARNGTLWVGGSNGLIRVTPSGRPRVTPVRRPGCGKVAQVVGGVDGGVWIASCRGVEWVSDDGATVQLVVPRPASKMPVRLVAEANPDGLWVADVAGVQRYAVTRGVDGRRKARLTYENSLDLGGAAIVAMVGDRAGGVWVGTRTAGLRHVRRLRVRRLTIADGLPDRPVHHLAPDGATGIWIGTGEGLARWRSGRLEVIPPGTLGSENRGVFGLFTDRTGGLWAGIPSGISRLAPDGVVRRMLTFPQVRERDGTALLEDRRGRVWFGTSRGDAGFFPSVTGPPVTLRSDLLPDQRVWSMVEDGEHVWIGQEGTVSRLQDSTLDLRLTEQDGIPPGPVRALRLDTDGSLWIVTYGGGLARWRQGSGVTRVPLGGARFDPRLSSLRIDTDGRFWVFGDGGLQVFRRDDLLTAMAKGHPPQAEAELGVEAGVPEGNAGYSNTWFDPVSNWLWLATVDGLAAVDLRSYPFTDPEAPIRIDEVQIDGVAAERPDSVVVPAAANALEIRLSTPRLDERLSVRLRYRLVSYDREWVTVGGVATARYPNLPPGRYLFEVASGRQDGRSGGPRTAMVVRVLPHWWQTIVARIVGAFLLIAGLWMVIHVVTRRLRLRNESLRRLIEDREVAVRAAAEAARDLSHVSRLATAGELATSIAHELNQPLTAIMSNAQRARHLVRRPPGEELEPALEAIVDQTDRAAAVLRSLRAFVAKHPFEHDDVAIEQVVTDSLRLLADELTRRGVPATIQDDRRSASPVRGNPVQLQQVLINLVLNAADAMAGNPPTDRAVTVSISDVPPDGITLSVADRGPGISPAQVGRIFEPFYSTKHGGLGLGLSLSRSIVEAHAGRIWAEAPSGGGTVLHVYLPLAKP